MAAGNKKQPYGPTLMAAGCLVMLLQTVVDVVTAVDLAPEQKLVEKLLANYNPKLRPVRHSAESLIIWLKLDAYQLIDVVL